MVAEDCIDQSPTKIRGPVSHAELAPDIPVVRRLQNHNKSASPSARESPKQTSRTVTDMICAGEKHILESILNERLN